jgi:hypothetical protein
MKFVEITGGLAVPISNEEMLVMERVKSNPEPLPRRKLDEREQELARRLVFRGVLDRTKIDGQLCYTYNDIGYAERD